VKTPAQLASTCLIVLLLLWSFATSPNPAAGRQGDQTLHQQLQQIVTLGQAPISREPIRQSAFLLDAYTRESFNPLWPRPEQARQLLAAIGNSAQDGLRPDDYHQQALLLLGRRLAQQADASTAAEYDILLTDALLSLGHDKLYGKNRCA
jgi:murein L,D-transpeptidase YcbB/YkuD